MANKHSLNVTTLDQTGKKSTKSVTDINPAATGEQLTNFAEALNDLTNNTYINSAKVQVTDLGATPTLQRTVYLEWDCERYLISSDTVIPVVQHDLIEREVEIFYTDYISSLYLDGAEGTVSAFKCEFVAGGDIPEGHVGKIKVASLDEEDENGDPIGYFHIVIPGDETYAELDVSIKLKEAE